MTDQTPVTFPWRTDFENAPSPCIGWCTPPAGDDVRQIWRHSHLKGQWTAHSITQTVKAWQPLPSIGIDGGVAQQPSSAAREKEITRLATITECADVVGNMRQSEAGLFDTKHSGLQGASRADALYDAYVAIRALSSQGASK